MKLTVLWIVTLCLPALAWSLTCHRCFGYGFCHDPDHEDFAEGVREATCSGNSYWSLSDNAGPFERMVAKALNDEYNKNFLKNSSRNTILEQNCITTRVHEPHNSYTFRTCITRAVPTAESYPTLCEFINSMVDPQNHYNGSLSCRQCNEDYCNNVVLAEGDGVGGRSNSVTSEISLLVGSIVALLARYLY